MKKHSLIESLRISGICERDVDLLLLEEFHSSKSFRSWFLEKTLGTVGKNARLIDASRSVVHAGGESDIEVTVGLPNKQTWLCLIENKVGAAFQPRQAARYTERGECRVANGICTHYHTILVAPRKYARDSSSRRGFQSFIALEEIVDWFENEHKLGERRLYKKRLLSAAIEKGTTGYQAIEDEPVTEFWRTYWKESNRLAPELQMPEPIGKPSKAGFILFRPDNLPTGVRLLHKLRHGHVDIEFKNMGNRCLVLQGLNDSQMGLKVAKTNKSAVLRFDVPRVSTMRPFGGQIASAQEGILAAQRLLFWFVENKGKFRKVLGRQDAAVEK